MCADQKETYPEEITDIPIGGKRDEKEGGSAKQEKEAHSSSINKIQSSQSTSIISLCSWFSHFVVQLCLPVHT
jgi:hypothetical protein